MLKYHKYRSTPDREWYEYFLDDCADLEIKSSFSGIMGKLGNAFGLAAYGIAILGGI